MTKGLSARHRPGHEDFVVLAARELDVEATSINGPELDDEDQDDDEDDDSATDDPAGDLADRAHDQYIADMMGAL